MKIDIEKFDGNGDYKIWRRKLKGLLAQQKLLKALEDPLTFSDDYLEDQKQELLEMAMSSMILHLSDAIIFLIDKEETPT